MRKQCENCLCNIYMTAPDYHIDENTNILAGERCACLAYENGIPEDVANDTQRCEHQTLPLP